LLGDKLLCCCLQFGYFNKKAFASLDSFLERLDPSSPGCRMMCPWPSKSAQELADQAVR
jgi:hypothetical protein